MVLIWSRLWYFVKAVLGSNRMSSYMENIWFLYGVLIWSIQIWGELNLTLSLSRLGIHGNSLKGGAGETQEVKESEEEEQWPLMKETPGLPAELKAGSQRYAPSSVE